MDVGINGTCNLLNLCLKSKKLKNFHYASSSEVYGEPLKNPITEKDITQGKTVYAISKLCGEELVKAYSSEFKNFNFDLCYNN